LTDSIAAVEAAWGKVATDLGLDPAYVIAATHGKRATDNLAQFRPEIKNHEMDGEVAKFEQTILDFADAFGKARSRRESISSSATASSAYASGSSTPALSIGSPSEASSGFSSRADSFSAPNRPSFSFSSGPRRPSFGARLNNMLKMSSLPEGSDDAVFEDEKDKKDNALVDIEAAWEIESDSVDRSIHILPGVKKMMDSIPKGRYAVATSGAKTYGKLSLTIKSQLLAYPFLPPAYGAMTRVGITPPPVTITADDKRLKAGKPAPDPFLLAASCLGYDAKKCVVFEDSPSGIRAGVASGATVIALCTSHPREKIENCGAHFLVEDMTHVRCEVMTDGGLKFHVTA
jgi:beta-phosphoglucomutase-like phosphatase (HAD superfamily)